MKRVSVIIVTYNSEKHIYDCLDSVFKYNDIGDDLEVIIVDNKSKNFQTLKEDVENKYNDKVLIISNERNGGYGQGNNIGIRKASAPIIMIMNPDVRLTMPIFNQVCTAFQEDINIVMYGMKQKFSESHNGISIDCTSLLNPIISIPLSRLANKYDWYTQKYMYFSGACFFVRKQSFEEAGLFDEDIFMYSEEDDIHNRLLKIPHCRFVYNPRISYLHLHHLYRKNEINEMNTFPYIQRLKSQLIWKSKLGFSKESIKHHFVNWVKVLYYKALLFNCGKTKKTDFYKLLIDEIKTL